LLDWLHRLVLIPHQLPLLLQAWVPLRTVPSWLWPLWVIRMQSKTRDRQLSFYCIGVLNALGVTTNDSDHDYDGVNGRLVFQIGNSCVPNLQTRDVYAIFSKINLGVETEGNIPLEFAVHENYPNPFNPTTKIRFDLPEFSQTKVTIWNMLGQKVATLFSGELPAGSHSITFDARNENGNLLPSGVYIYRVESGSYVATKKMMLLK